MDLGIARDGTYFHRLECALQPLQLSSRTRVGVSRHELAENRNERESRHREVKTHIRQEGVELGISGLVLSLPFKLVVPKTRRPAGSNLQ